MDRQHRIITANVPEPQLMPLKERYAPRNLPCFAQRISFYTHAPTKSVDCPYLRLRSNLPRSASPERSFSGGNEESLALECERVAAGGICIPPRRS